MKILTRSFALILLALIVGLLTGCGGSGASTSQVKPKVIINWPSLTRGVNAPPYAGSAFISLTFGSSNSPSRWFVDRPASTGAQTIGYDCPDAGAVGPGLLVITFQTGAGGTGNSVASAAASVKIDESGNLLNSEGGPLGTVTYSSQISGFSVNRNNISVGQSAPLVVSGLAFGSVVALPQDLVTTEIVENPQNATLLDRILTGVIEGTFRVHISFESISDTFGMTVSPVMATVHRANFAANQIAWDPIHRRMWGTFGPNTAYPNSIVDIDPVTGFVGNPIAVGSNPNMIAVSPDGSTAYVGLDGASAVRKVDLNSRIASTATNIVLFGETGRIIGLDVNPGNPNEFAACMQASDSSGYGGPVVFRDGSQVGVEPGLYTAQKVTYASSSSIFGAQPGTIYAIEVALNSVDFLSANGSFFNLQGDAAIAGSKAILPSGTTYDSTSLALLGQLTFSNEEIQVVATDNVNDVAWAITATTNLFEKLPRLRSFELSNYSPTAGVSLPFSLTDEFVVSIKRFGTTGITVLTSKALYVLSSAPGL